MVLVGFSSSHHSSSHHHFFLSNSSFSAPILSKLCTPFHVKFHPHRTAAFIWHRPSSSLLSLRSCTSSVRAENEASTKESAGRKKSIHDKKVRNASSIDRTSKHVGKGFSALAELIPQQDPNSDCLIDGRKNSSRGHPRSHHMMKAFLESLHSEDDPRVISASKKNLPRNNFSRRNDNRIQDRKVADEKDLSGRANKGNKSERHSIDNRTKHESSAFQSILRSSTNTIHDGRTNSPSQTPANLWNQNPAEAIFASRQSFGQVSNNAEGNSVNVDSAEKPSLRGQEILMAMQKASMERAKLKQKNRTSETVGKAKGNASSRETLDWRDARPIVIRPEWALQIEDLERRINDLKNMRT